ncbi:MAG TPA: hypothetical protein VKP67_16625 [Xanthobacteraceae bacterium]|nr:hypothetical protein [Xanthobacteraceae bacterium]
MPLISKPNPLPSELTYVPENGDPHTVATGESWWTLVELPLVRAARKSASDLCYFNFKTRNPREINWYLHHKVGCRHVTRDGKNYMFSDFDRLNKDAATPGIIYLPRVWATLPTITSPADELRLDIWVGLGGKAGTMFVVAGIETMEGLVVGIDQPHTWMALQASISRLGVGWGVSGGACLIVVTGVKKPSQLNGFQTGGGDFTLALGENWDKIAKAGGAAKKFAPIIEAIKRIGAKTPKALKAALKADPDRYGDLVKAVGQFREALGAGAEEQNVYLVDVPWLGGGAEASLYYGVATYTALWDSG